MTPHQFPGPHPAILAHAPRLVWHILLPILVWLAPRDLIPDPIRYIRAGIALTLATEAQLWLLGFDLSGRTGMRWTAATRRVLAAAVFGTYLIVALAYFAWTLKDGRHREATFAYACTLIIFDCAWRERRMARNGGESPQPTPSRFKEQHPGPNIVDLYTPRVLGYITLGFLSAYYPLNVHLLIGYVAGSVTGLVGMRRFIHQAGVRFLKSSAANDTDIAVMGRPYFLMVAVAGLLAPLLIAMITEQTLYMLYGQGMVLGAIEYRLWQGEILMLANDGGPPQTTSLPDRQSIAT